jgi:glycosyltransferase involved in cell wall biosynthesis
MTLIEAMACGCPVVAFKRGSSFEIVKNNKTGFVVEDIDEMVLAVSQIEKISREDCRKYALQNFNEKKMADGYEKIYQKILAERSHNIESNGNMPAVPVRHPQFNQLIKSD